MSMSPAQYEVLGAVKIKDGVFVGDDLAAQDLEFVVANKVTHVINCSGRQVPNHYETIGVMYSTHFWQDNETEVILDHKDGVANDIFNFIEGCLSSAESVLIHSVRGQSRSCCVLAAYLMKKYSWSLRKTMEFVLARRPDLNLSRNFLEQLSAYERRLGAKHRLSDSWTDIPASGRANPLVCEELLLRNTYLNGQMVPGSVRTDVKERGTQRLLWADNGTDDKSVLEAAHDATRHKRSSGLEPKSILHKKKTKEPSSYQSRPTTASSETEASKELRGSACWSDRGQPSDSMGDRRKPAAAWGEDTNGHGARPSYFPERDIHGFDARECRDRDARDPESRNWCASRDRESRADDMSQRVPSPGPGARADPSTRGRFLPHSKPKSDRYDPQSALRSRREASPKSDRDRFAPRAESPLKLLSKTSQPRLGPTLAPSRSNSNVINGTVINGPPMSTFSRPPGNNGVMGAYRGPVKAKVEFLAADYMRKRPSTAPTSRQSYNRPASPLGVCRQSSNSRPLSPNTRPSTKTFVPSYPGLDKQMCLSSHMRRAPSPTPAFNRATSPNKPRWRM